MTAPLPEPGDRRRTLLAFAPYLVRLGRCTSWCWSRASTRRRARRSCSSCRRSRSPSLLTARPLRGAVPVLLLRRDRLLVGRRRAAEHSRATWFVVGLASFLLAHVTYIVLFLRLPARGRRLPAWTVAYAAWYVAFLALLQPHLGGLLVPVALYGLVLGVMAAIAGRPGRVSSPSAARCSSSRTRCWRSGGSCRATSSPPHDLVVMSTYLAAQGLIALGVVRVQPSEGQLRRRSRRRRRRGRRRRRRRRATVARCRAAGPAALGLGGLLHAVDELGATVR